MKTKTYKAIRYQNFSLCQFESDNKYGIPTIPKCNAEIENLITFNYAMSYKGDKSKTWVCFYIEDYQFERVWNNPDRYFKILSEYAGIVSPEFSVYLDFPMAMKIWNTYRNRFIGAYYAQLGMKVIPAVQWGDIESLDYCLCGIEEGSDVFINNINLKHQKNNVERKNIDDNAIEKLKSITKDATIHIYGKDIHNLQNKKEYKIFTEDRYGW